MELLHPVFTVSALILVAFSIMEGFRDEYKNYRAVWFVIAGLIIFSGFRLFVGADYGSYLMMYGQYGQTASYSEILQGATFKTTTIEVEWLYVLIGKLFFDLGIPFQGFTFVIALFSIIPKFISFEKNSVYPALSWLLYMFPHYFTADSGQMRQAVAMGIILLSFQLIKQRKLLPFILTIYLAMSFHKSSVIFLPAYWLVKVKLNSRTILALILVCVALSPLKVYNYIGVLSSIAPEEVFAGYSDYIQIEGDTGSVGFTDAICLLYTFFLVVFDKSACEKIPYYEYVRNLTVGGICLYFLMKGSPIFSSRLTAIYLVFSSITIPNIIASVSNLPLRRYLYTVMLSFVVFYYFIYTKMQADRINFTTSKYHNILWN